MTDEPVHTSDLTGADQGVRVVRMHRPERRNALDLRAKELLTEALVEADRDPNVGAVVLTGSDTVFAAGTDVAEMATLSPTDHLVRQTGRLFSVLDELETPTIAAVEGYALGGGCELAMACDLVVAGASARFGQPEIRVGLVTGAGGLSRLVQRAGRARALRMVLTGESVDAAEARELGVVGDVVDDGRATEEAVRLARTVVDQAPLNVRAVRKVARHAENAPLTTAVELERTTFQLLFDTADHAEGLAAFLDKRGPTYSGR